MVRRKWRLCKMHNGVFGMVESRINTECLPFVRGDESDTSFHYQKGKLSALRKRG